MNVIATLPTRCRYCAENADLVVEGWRFPPALGEGATDDDPFGTGHALKPDRRIPVCLVHASTGRLRLVSEGFTPELQTEFDLGAWHEGVIGERKKRRRR